MKRKTLIATILLLGSVAVGTSRAAGTPVEVKVKGMVCSFCAQGLDKKFRAQPEVEDVKVTLKDKVIRLTVKDGQALPDETIRKIVQDAGYNVESIER